MKCSTCNYTGLALAVVDAAGKPFNVCPECSTPITPAEKPWERLGIPKARYLTTQPWKTAKMERKTFEKILIHVSPEAIQCLKHEAEAERLLEAMNLK